MDEKYDLSKYVDKLYSAAVKKVGDTYVAEDIVQETFLAAIEQLSRRKSPRRKAFERNLSGGEAFHGKSSSGNSVEDSGWQPPDNLWAWLLRILSNKYCDWLREKYKRPQISFEDYPFEIADESVQEDESEEQMEAIRRELGYLAQSHREVMVRFYMHGQSVERIAQELQIPVGTVKSRLNIGRQRVRKGVEEMENETKQSYEPDTLRIACSGGPGLHNEPFCHVDSSDKLTQSILITAYSKPLTETEIARILRVPAAFVEPVVTRLVDGELMCRTEGGKVYTDFIIYTDRDRKATFGKQMDVAGEHFGLFWAEMEQGLSVLRERAYYKRQTEHARAKLELHFCVKTLMNAHMDVRDEVTGRMPYSEYPYRKDGGRWIAMGMQYPAASHPEDDSEFRKYSVNGEMGYVEQNFRDAAYIELRGYGTSLGQWRDFTDVETYVKWFYELLEKAPAEESVVNPHILQAADWLTEDGFLRRGDTLEPDIPVLTRAEHRDECALAAEYEKKIAARTREILLPIFESGYVKLPAHLKSVPKWQQYMLCGDSIPMAVIFKAREKKLFLDGADYPLPAILMIYEKV